MASKKSAKKAAGKKTAKKAAPKKATPKKAAPKKAAPAKKRAAKRAAPARAVKRTPGVPAGFHTVTPALVFKDTRAAIKWYGEAFGAKELSVMPSPDGKSVWHAEIQIGDSFLYLNDESPMGATIAPHGPRTGTAGMQLYVSDADAWVKRAADAGAHVIMPISDMFWGDRMGVISDPFGHVWSISTRVKELTPQEMHEAGEAFARQFAEKTLT
jgi:uncharacterized glyoxalase superfamily protein PhnB